MENFFQYFEDRTGYPPVVAKQAIQVISRHVAKNYKSEFIFLVQYFLTLNFEQNDHSRDTVPERYADNQNL